MMMHRVIATVAGFLLAFEPLAAQADGAADAAAQTCRRLAVAQTEPALKALRAFTVGRRPVAARVRCARYLGNAATLNIQRTNGVAGPYAAQAIDGVIALFKDPDPRIRTGAARALWGVQVPKAGIELLTLALADPVPSVREAAFTNLGYAMLADIRTNHDKALYAAGIAKGLRSADSHGVAGALAASAFLEGERAEPLFRRYAFDARPAVRIGAIRAFGKLSYRSVSINDFVESRLNDRSAAVRAAVLDELAEEDNVWAIPRVTKLAAAAASTLERAQARQTLELLNWDAKHNNFVPLKKYP